MCERISAGDRVDRGAGSPFPEGAWRDAHPEAGKMGKFTAADVVRRWNPDAKNSTEAMRSRLSTILGKAKKLPEEEDLLRSWGEKMRRLYRLEWGRDMDEVARIGVLESGALEDAEVARLYGEVIAALPRALPMMRRMGYAEGPAWAGRAR